MKKIAGLLLAAVLLFCRPVWADQPTTILTELNSTSALALQIPVIDGANSESFQQAANAVLRKAVQEVADKIGRRGSVTYEVTLNRPSLVSLLLKGENGDKRYAQAVNLDLTTGKPFGPDAFFFDVKEREAILDGKAEDVLFTETGIWLRGRDGGTYVKHVSYGDLLPLVRIGDIGRLMTVWKLTENSNGKVLTVPAGSLFAFRLSANPSTGYQWIDTVSGGPSRGLFLAGSSFAIPHDTPQGQSGTPGTQIRVYAARQPGTYQLSLSYERPWEKMSAFRECKVTVIVK